MEPEGFLPGRPNQSWNYTYKYQYDDYNQIISLFFPKDKWGTGARFIFTREQIEQMAMLFGLIK